MTSINCIWPAVEQQCGLIPIAIGGCHEGNHLCPGTTQLPGSAVVVHQQLHSRDILHKGNHMVALRPSAGTWPLEQIGLPAATSGVAAFLTLVQFWQVDRFGKLAESRPQGSVPDLSLFPHDMHQHVCRPLHQAHLGDRGSSDMLVLLCPGEMPCWSRSGTFALVVQGCAS